MIRSEVEYKEAVRRLEEERARIKASRKKLAETRDPDDVKRALEPVETFYQQLQEDVEIYERLKRGEFDELENLQGLGPLLIGLRIYRGLTQKQLADLLGTHESQVSRDEHNEYHNITLERANRILEALRVELRSEVNLTEKVMA
jgi:DNA-binding XRE family transcriptional regulator